MLILLAWECVCVHIRVVQWEGDFGGGVRSSVGVVGQRG